MIKSNINDLDKFSLCEDDILFEDNHLIIINKKPSQIVQGDKTGDKALTEIVKEYLVKKYDKKGDAFIGLVHRLDRPVSGAIIFAKTSKALSRMNTMLKNQELKKSYLAIVTQKPRKHEEVLIDFLVKNEKQNKSYVVPENTANAKKASLEYRLIGESERFFLLLVELHTGRHHQIRTQLANIGCIIKGDLKYGDKRSNPDMSICLHAYSLEFIHPVSKELIAIKAPPPASKPWIFFQDFC